jgi:hypothetical protein
MAVGIRYADHVTSSIRKKLALTSLTSGGRSVGIVRSRTEAMDFFYFLLYISVAREIVCFTALFANLNDH